MYNAKISGSVKIRYNPEIFSIYDKDVNVKINDDYTDYKFATYTSKIKSLEYFKVKFIQNEQKMQR